ncbi:DUF6510 family protein [Phytomonospora sp. NPDC050363]|uniref:DUF6510 family protein n=1 Tax=Phytomonospora sp. NPDC050363 TaxID=3155642 RepID=UPI0033F12358
MTTLDGNVLAGPLAEIFARDMTGARGRCGNCSRTGALATLVVYTDAPGLVARCPGCAHVTVRITRTAEGTCLDLSGLAFLRIPDER